MSFVQSRKQFTLSLRENMIPCAPMSALEHSMTGFKSQNALRGCMMLFWSQSREIFGKGCAGRSYNSLCISLPFRPRYNGLTKDNATRTFRGPNIHHHPDRRLSLLYVPRVVDATRRYWFCQEALGSGLVRRGKCPYFNRLPKHC